MPAIGHRVTKGETEQMKSRLESVLRAGGREGVSSVRKSEQRQFGEAKTEK